MSSAVHTPVIRVVVVDDSAVIREMLADAIAAEPGMEVAGTAHDADSALRMIAAVRPHVVTLDIQMPGRNGLQLLGDILWREPVPVVMVSALTTVSAPVTLDALQRGAVDYVGKPSGGQNAQREFTRDVVRKLRVAAGCDVGRLLEIRARRANRTAPRIKSSPLSTHDGTYDGAAIALGISTGGPPALAELFARLHPPLPPIFVVQHMPAPFTPKFAERLDALSPLAVHHAEHGQPIVAGEVYLAPGGMHLSVSAALGKPKLAVRAGEPVAGHVPSVDVLMTSAAQVYGARCLGVTMTGMGHDSVAGCKAIRAAGGYVLGQDQASSAVYGMNKAAFTAGAVDEQFALDEADVRITALARQRLRRPTTVALSGKTP